MHSSGPFSPLSPTESNYSIHDFSPVPPTPAFTVGVETLSPDDEEIPDEELVQSDGPPSSTGPHEQPDTPSPTVSSFGFKAEARHPPTRRRLSERTRESLASSFTRIKNASKASVVLPVKASRAFSHLTHSRKVSKSRSEVDESALKDTDAYHNESDPDPFRTSSLLEQEATKDPSPVAADSAPEEHNEPTGGEKLTTSPEELTWGLDSTTFTKESGWEEDQTTSPDQFAWPGYAESDRSSRTNSRAPTIRRSSLKNTIAKFSNPFRQSSKVSFRHPTPEVSAKRLSPIASSNGHSSFAHGTQPPTGDATSSFVDRQTFPGSSEFLAPRHRTSSTRAPSVHVTPVSLPVDTAPGVVSPLELTASPSVWPSEFGSPAQSTLPPPSRPQSWWFPPSQVFTPPPPPTSDPPSAQPPDLQLDTSALKPRASYPTLKSKTSRSFPWKASTSQFAPSLPSHHTSAPSAAPSHWSEHTASSAVPPPSQPAARSRAPAIARSSESILFPQNDPFGENQRVSQAEFQSRVPSINPSQIPLPSSTFATPLPSVASNSRRSSFVKVIVIDI